MDVDPGGRRRDRELARRRRRRRTLLAWAGRIAALALAFFLGVALGRAITKEPRAGGTQTLVRTLKPQTVSSPAATVTVTTSVP